MADAQLVAAIGPDSAWSPLAIGQLFKTDRLDAARTVAIGLAEARRRGVGARVRRGVDLARMDALREGAAADAEADARAAYEVRPVRAGTTCSRRAA